MFIVGAIPDKYIMKKITKKVVSKVHKAKKSFWSKVTGGRMK
jgi:hypothetical protein